MPRLLLPFLLILALLRAQSHPTFDAASIKLAEPDDLRGATFEFPPGGLRITNGTLRAILETAYSVREFQIVGGPKWLDSDRYVIYARSTPGAAGGIPETRLKLQALLAERFHLTVHRETRELPILALVASKGGFKLKEAPGDAQGAGIRTECGRMTGTRTTIENVAVYLERLTGRPVADRTGIPGRYDFRLEWTPDSGPCAPSDETSPSLFTTLQEVLGLKLEAAKGPVEVLVVDHAEKADEN